MQRHLIGIIGLAGIGYALFVFFRLGYDDGLNQIFPSLCMRLGIVMIAIWLGMPDINRLLKKYPLWLIILAVVAVIGLIVSPKIFPILFGIFVIGCAYHFLSGFFRSKRKK